MKSVEIEVRTPSEMIQVLVEYEQQMHLVQQRAYHLFEQRGSGHGQDLDDWLTAQSQTLCLPQAQADEDGASYHVQTSLAGFTADRMRVIVSPREMVLRAEAGKPSRPQGSAAFSLKAMTYYRFTHPVKLDEASAQLRGGVLHITIPKQPCAL